MSAFPFIGGSYEARGHSLDAQRTVNLYVEMSGSGTSRAPSALYGMPGLTRWATLAGGGIRGLLRVSPDLALAVAGPNVYRLDAQAAAALVGALDTNTGPVSMASNGAQALIVTGAAGYVFDVAAGSLARITDPDFSGADAVAFVDGYFIVNKPGTGQFQISNLYGADFDALDFATAEGTPDLLVSLIVDHRELWLFGQTSTEVFFNSGNADFPFERIQGAFIEHGCIAPQSVAKLDNSVFWLSADDKGQGVVMRATGYQPQRVSTHAVETAISGYADISDAVAWTYQQEGHAFYVLSFPSADRTWCFDASTGLWTERAWRNPATGVLGRHRGGCHMAFAGRNIVGDWETGKLYALDLDAYTDDGDALPRIRRCPHLAHPDALWQFFHRLQLVMDAGVGTVSGQGAAPVAMLRWSDDGGATWSNEITVSIGRIGERRARVLWRRLGKSRDRVFEVTITDPVRVAITAASVDVSVGGA